MPSNGKNYSRLLPLLLIAALLCSCTPPAASPPYFKDIYQSTRKTAQPEPEAAGQAGAEGKEQSAAAAKKPLVRIVALPNYLTTETVTAAAEKGGVPLPPKGAAEQPAAEVPPKPLTLNARAAAGDVQISVENMPIYEFVNLAFGEVLKLNYVVAPDVQSSVERITMNMGIKIPSKEFFPIVVDLLRKNNLVIEEENGVLAVSRKPQPAPAAMASAPGTDDLYIGNTVPQLPPQKRIVFIYTSHNLQAGQIMQLVRQMQMLNGDIRVDYMMNNQSVALFGTAVAVEKTVNLLNQLDRPTFARRDINLIYFDYMNVVDFDKKLKEVLPAFGVPIARGLTENGLMTIPLDKINALLVLTQKKEWLDLLLTWKEKLDAVDSLGDEPQMFIYQPKNRPAEDLVDVLKSVANGGATPAPATVLGQGGRQVAAPRIETPSPQISSAALPGKFSAILDKGRNAVIVTATPANFKLIRNTLIQLDTPPRQVLIEATIMEVTLTDNLQYGVEWFLQHNAGNFQGSLTTLGGLALGGSGLNFAVSKLTGDIQAKINMYGNKSLINIISTPHIAMLDGKEASINVGTEVPIVTAESSASDIGSSSTTPSILRSVQYRNTGTILRVKPIINSDGALTLDVSQELSEAQTNSVSSIDSPLILNRSIRTTLLCKSGETVLLGGLISTNKSTGESKVPILGDLPLIGHLFKTNSKGLTKTELLIQITPYILNDLEQLDEITKKFKENVFLQDQ